MFDLAVSGCGAMRSCILGHMRGAEDTNGDVSQGSHCKGWGLRPLALSGREYHGSRQ
jgi:hypothetical protein